MNEDSQRRNTSDSEALRQALSDVEIALLTAVEHSEVIENELLNANDKMISEIRERIVAERRLAKVLEAVSRKNEDLELNRVCYRMSAMMLDLDDPTKVIARCEEPLMEPEHYYEKVGHYIPNVVFPTGAVEVDGILHIYYGCCDTAIGLATVPLQDLVDHVMSCKL